MGYGYEGKLVRLVPVEKDKHLENCLRWINDPEVTQYILGGHFPMTRLAEEEWFDKLSKNVGGSDFMFAIETLDGVHIGNSGLHGIDYRHGIVTTGTLIGEKSYWNKGYGTDQARVRAKYIFDVLGLRLILTGAFEGNVASIRMSMSIGHKEVGFIPQKYWKNGRYLGEHLMACTREDFVR